MSTADETTPLLGSETLVDQSTPRPYTKQNKKYHICAFITLLVILALAGAATVWFLSENKRVSFAPDSRNASLKQLLGNTWPRPDARIESTLFSPGIAAVVSEAIGEGKQKLDERETIEKALEPISSSSPSYKHQYAIVYSQLGYNLSKLGYVENEATKYLQNKGYTAVVHYGSSSELKWAKESECDKLNDNLNCSISKYRTVDGSCNNLNHPQTWGVAMTPFRRALPASYNDGVSDPRGGFVSDLPSARDISTMVHRPVHREDNNFSVMLAVWGQFIDHDITATALSRGVNGSTISCCNAKVNHPECFPVLLNKNDEYYSKYDITCMEFVRSAAALKCSFGPREQLNQASSYLDGSMIYGNTISLSEKLRTFEGGRLAMSYTKDGRELLPFSKDPIDGCNQAEEIEKGRYCFLSGDSRANENSHLTSIHLIFARQHNVIAKQLSTFNPDWDDETLYQETKRIVIAQVQHITYNEFLPIIIGSDLMTKLKLYSSTDGHWSEYNSKVDATISNNFAASSFRFAHTLIPRLMKLLANDTSSPEYVEMHKMLFNPFGLYEGDLDAIIRGAINTDIEKADNYFTTQLTEHLFESKTKTNSSRSFGLDLVALNIQRGRDHGLPSYPYWREYCGFSKVTSFEELETVFDAQSLKIISSIYKSVDEIDLYTGSLSEYPIDGGLLGPTVTCLITDQFYRLKYGDRYWYETSEKPQAFTEEQLNEIRKTSLAGILCQNADDLDNITPSVMKSVSVQNEHVPCSNISQPDLRVFKADSGENPSLPQHQISDISVKITNGTILNKTIEIPKSYIDKLIKDGVRWKGTTSRHDKVTVLDGSFSFPSHENKTETGNFTLKFDDDGWLPYVPADTEILSPIYASNGDLNSAPERNGTFIPVIIYGNRTSDRFVWNGNFSVLSPHVNTSEERVDYLDEATSSDRYIEAKKRGWVPFKNMSHEDNEYRSRYFNEEHFVDPAVDHMDEKVLEQLRSEVALRDMKSAMNNRPPGDWRKQDAVLKFQDDAEARQLFSEIYQLKTLKNPSQESETCTITLTTDRIKIDGEKAFDIVPPTNRIAEASRVQLLTWRWSPNTESIRGNFTGDANGTFSLNYKTISGCPLTPNCVYYSRIVSSPDFELNAMAESEECTIIAPVILDNVTSWNGSITVVIRRPSKDLEKENELSLKNEETRFTFENVTGSVYIALEGGDIMLWNGSLPAVFEPKLNWLQNNDTVAYPVSWSVYYVGKSIMGSFLMPEKQENSYVWHDGKFTLNLGSNSDMLDAIQVYTSVVYLTSRDDVGYDIGELEDLEDWNLNQYSRIILKGNFSEGKFYWYGDVTLVIPKIADETTSSTYRPSMRYTGEVIAATLYAELSGPKYLWWSGELPTSVLIPAEMPRGYTQLFDHILIWTITSSNASVSHALFATQGSQSNISLSGDFDFHLASVLNSPNLSPNVTYYSPILLQQDTYDFSDDLVENFSSMLEHASGVRAPITLLGKYLKKDGLFSWNGKFVISILN